MNKEPTCYLFGQHEMPADKQPLLQQTVEKLITEQKARYFIFGNQGEFDRYALITLRQLKKSYPHIQYNAILAYYPILKKYNAFYDHETMFPAELTAVPKRFAVYRRNRLMLAQASVVVCYTPCSFGNSAKLLLEAKKLKKEIIQIV